MTQNDRPVVSGHVFWRCIWPILEAAGWESGLARDLEVGCRIYKPGMKVCRKNAQPGEDFFLYNDYDHGLLDYVLESGLVSAEDIWTPSSETQVQEHTEPPVDVPVAAIAAETAPAVGGPTMKKKGRAATPKKTPKTTKKGCRLLRRHEDGN